MSVNWDKLRREAIREYEERGEGKRRREAGSQAAAQAEELAWWAKHRPDGEPVPIGAVGPDAVRAAALVADQAVYVYRGPILLAKLEPSTQWDMVETPRGLKLVTLLANRQGSRGWGPEWEPGEWTFVGRGQPGE